MDGAAPHASALLDVDAAALPANAKRGLLIPRMTIAERPDAAVATVHPNPAEGPITVVAPGLYLLGPRGSNGVRMVRVQVLQVREMAGR